ERPLGEPPAPQTPAQQPAGETRMSEHSKPVILIVDDEPDIVTILQAGLRLSGFVVHTAVGGAEAVVVYRQHPEIDLVLLDVRMAGMNGPATLKALRRTNAAVRCCFICGYSDDELERQWEDQGVLMAFIKPFPDIGVLSHTLRLLAL